MFETLLLFPSRSVAVDDTKHMDLIQKVGLLQLTYWRLDKLHRVLE